jgi:hypothetical protein
MGLEIGDLVAIAFWASMLISTILAGIGWLRKSSSILFNSSILSAPFGFILALYPFPGSWVFFLLPLLHLGAALAIRTKRYKLSSLFILVIWLLAGGFFLFRIGSEIAL